MSKSPGRDVRQQSLRAQPSRFTRVEAPPSSLTSFLFFSGEVSGNSEYHPEDSQGGHRDLSPVTMSNRILPITWTSLEADSFPRLQNRTPLHRHLDFNLWDKNRNYAPPISDPQNCKTLSLEVCGNLWSSANRKVMQVITMIGTYKNSIDFTGLKIQREERIHLTVLTLLPFPSHFMRKINICVSSGPYSQN